MEQMAVRTESRFQPRKLSGLPQAVIEHCAFSAKRTPAYWPKVLFPPAPPVCQDKGDLTHNYEIAWHIFGSMRDRYRGASCVGN
jgi:hypothetical protein